MSNRKTDDDYSDIFDFYDSLGDDAWTTGIYSADLGKVDVKNVVVTASDEPEIKEEKEEIEITDKMVDAGKRALHEAIGCQYRGDAGETVRHVFKMMMKVYNQDG